MYWLIPSTQVMLLPQGFERHSLISAENGRKCSIYYTKSQKHKSTKSKMAYGDEDRTEVNSDLTVLQNWKIARPSYAEKGDFTKTEEKGTTRKKGLFTLPLSQQCYRKETSCYELCSLRTPNYCYIKFERNNFADTQIHRVFSATSCPYLGTRKGRPIF